MRRTATRHILTLVLALPLAWPFAVFGGAPESADAGSATSSKPSSEPAAAPVALDSDLERIKKDLLKLKRDLVILEEDLLFPASSQVAVFLSMDIGELFQLDAVSVKLNGKEVAHHLYTDRQVDALLDGAAGARGHLPARRIADADRAIGDDRIVGGRRCEERCDHR